MPNWMRIALFAAGIMNMFGAALFAPIFPQLRELNGLPNAAHPLYLWIISIWILAFGLCYLWLGFTGRHESLFLVIGAIGKLSFSLLLIAYWLFGELPAMTAASGLLDFLFAVLFLYWMSQERFEPTQI